MKRKNRHQPIKPPAAQSAHNEPSEANATWSAWNKLAVPVGLAIVTLIIFWPVTGFDFTNYDDPRYVTANAHVLSGLTWNNMSWAFRTGYASNWHPLTWISLMLDVQVFGTGAGGLHAMNLLFHVANTVLLFLALKQLTRTHWPSAVVAALFALHPLHVESVAWVSERKDVLSSFFAMLLLLAYGGHATNSAAAQKSEIISAIANVGSTRRVFRFLTSPYYWLALLWFALGLMSKPMLVTVPFVLLLLDYWPLRRWELKAFAGFARVALEKIPFLLLGTVSCAVTFVVQHKGGAVQSLTNFSMSERIGNAFVSYARYLEKTIWPENLAVYYPHPGHWPLMQIIFAMILICSACVGVLWFGRRKPFVITGWFWFLGMLLPVFGLVQVGDQSMADRYMYMPLVGLLIMLVWSANDLFMQWRLPRMAVALLAASACAVLAAQTTRQLQFWQNSESLLRHAIAVTKPNYLAHNNLGDALLQKGEVDDAVTQFQMALEIQPNCVPAFNNLGKVLLQKGKVNEAIVCSQKALELQPDYVPALNSLGKAFVQKGQLDEAIVCFQKALELDPDFAEAHNNLANILFQKGQVDQAIEHYQKALETEPGNPKIHHNLANAFLGKGQAGQAIEHFETALKINPRLFETHRKLAVVLAQNSRIDEAIIHFQRALETQPDDVETHNNLGTALFQKGRLDEATTHYQKALAISPDSVPIQNNLAQFVWALATSPEPTIRNGVKAIDLAQQTDRVSGDRNPMVIGALAAAYAEAGRFHEAVTNTQLALRLAEAENYTSLVVTLQEQLQCYSHGSTFRGGDTNAPNAGHLP